jgi:hypothetical protein
MLTLKLWRVVQILVLGTGVVFFAHGQKITRAQACNQCDGGSCPSGFAKGAAGCQIIDTHCTPLGTCDINGGGPTEEEAAQ